MSSQNSSQSRRSRFCITMLACLGLVVGATAVAQAMAQTSEASASEAARGHDWPRPAVAVDLVVLTVIDTFSRFSPVVDPRFSYRAEDVVIPAVLIADSFVILDLARTVILCCRRRFGDGISGEVA